jgi:hypothetical protein
MEDETGMLCEAWLWMRGSVVQCRAWSTCVERPATRSRGFQIRGRGAYAVAIVAHRRSFLTSLNNEVARLKTGVMRTDLNCLGTSTCCKQKVPQMIMKHRKGP